MRAHNGGCAGRLDVRFKEPQHALGPCGANYVARAVEGLTMEGVPLCAGRPRCLGTLFAEQQCARTPSRGAHGGGDGFVHISGHSLQ